jgi:hypothetical protein
MKKLFAFLIAFGVGISIQPARADLGSAEMPLDDKSYDAWCWKLKNNCKVTFHNGNQRLSVNGGTGILKEQVVDITHRSDPQAHWTGGVQFDYYYLIEYKDNKTGGIRAGLIIFKDYKTAVDFEKRLFAMSNKNPVRVSDLITTTKPEAFPTERRGELSEMARNQTEAFSAMINLYNAQTQMNQQNNNTRNNVQCIRNAYPQLAPGMPQTTTVNCQ